MPNDKEESTEPVATTTDGIFIAGTCVAPKDIPDSVAQARAAAARILARIAKEKIEVDALYSEVNEELCSGCRFCNQLCPLNAIEFNEEKRQSHIISVLCKGCGVGVAALRVILRCSLLHPVLLYPSQFHERQH